MNFRDLEYYQQLVIEKKFIKVAEYFQVSQPTVTYAIQRLEKELGSQLLIRDQSHHRIELTPAGEVFAQYTTKLLHEYASAKKALTQLQAEKIRFGLPPIVGNYYFPEISAQLVTHHLLQAMHLIEGGSKDLLQLLQSDQLDMALLGSIQPIRDPLLNSELLIETPFVIVVGKTHHLANRTQLSFSELLNEEFLLLDEHYIHPLAFADFTAQAHMQPNIMYQSSDLAILKSMIRSGIGIGFLTELALQPTDELIGIPIKADHQPTFMVSFIHHQDLLLTPLCQKIMEVIKAIVHHTL